MLKRTEPLRRSVQVEEGLAKSSNKQHLQNTDNWHLGETLGDLGPVYHLFTIKSEITLPQVVRHVKQHSRKKKERKKLLQNAEENKLASSLIFLFCQPHQLVHLRANHTYSCFLYTSHQIKNPSHQNTVLRSTQVLPGGFSEKFSVQI